MKIKLKREWTKRFAWRPVVTNTGPYDIGCILWLTTYYYRFEGANTHGNGFVRIQSKTDMDNYYQMYNNIKADPKRFGNDPYRRWE